MGAEKAARAARRIAVRCAAVRCAASRARRKSGCWRGEVGLTGGSARTRAAGERGWRLGAAGRQVRKVYTSLPFQYLMAALIVAVTTPSTHFPHPPYCLKIRSSDSIPVSGDSLDRFHCKIPCFLVKEISSPLHPLGCFPPPTRIGRTSPPTRRRRSSPDRCKTLTVRSTGRGR
jgi:hypothetical protein